MVSTEAADESTVDPLPGAEGSPATYVTRDQQLTRKASQKVKRDKAGKGKAGGKKGKGKKVKRTQREKDCEVHTPRSPRVENPSQLQQVGWLQPFQKPW